MVTNIVADLLDTAQRREIGDRIREHNPPRQGHPRRQTGHILLRNSCVEELLGIAAGEIGDHTKAQIPHHQRDSGIVRGDFRERFDEAGSHVSFLGPGRQRFAQSGNGAREFVGIG